MTLNSPTQAKEKSPAYSLNKATSLWKWEKKHCLLVIAVVCLALWWFATPIKEITWFKNIANLLPLIGSSAFALEALTKLV